MGLMRVVIQRASSASVTIDGAIRSSIGPGLLVLLGIAPDDTAEDLDYLCHKVVNLRVFTDDAGVMNRALRESGGEILLVSQFTLLASTRKGNRPSYSGAAAPALALPLYQAAIAQLSQLLGRPVKTGEFGADMQVGLVNDGPVTLVIDSKVRE